MAAIQADDTALLQEGESAKLSEEAYRRAVLRSPHDVSEQEVDAQLEEEARQLGLHIEPISNLSLISSSTSDTTIDRSQESLTQQYTAPASNSASELRQSSRPVATTAPVPDLLRRATTSYIPDAPVRPFSILRSLSKMATLRRRRSDKPKSIHSLPPARQPSRLAERMVGMRGTESCFNTQTRNDSWPDSEPPASMPAELGKSLIDRSELHKGMASTESVSQRPVSARPQSDSANESRESCFDTQTKICSWSMSLTLNHKSLEEDGKPVELDATQSLHESPEFQELQSEQLAERGRFIEYQRKCLKNLRQGLEESKRRRQEAHAAVVEETKAKNEKSLGKVESRQLEAELKLIDELEAEGRTCIIRLRHMEAYCHSPSCASSPPQTPLSASDRSSIEMRPSSLAGINTNSSFLSDSSSSSDMSMSTTPTDPTPHQSSLSQTALPPINALPSPPSPPLPPTSPTHNPTHSSSSAPAPLTRIPFTRTPTDKDFTLLAGQYRLRDTLSTLHHSRITVLRGRQEKQVQNLLASQSRELAELREDQDRELVEMQDRAEQRRLEMERRFQTRWIRLNRRWVIEVGVRRARAGAQKDDDTGSSKEKESRKEKEKENEISGSDKSIGEVEKGLDLVGSAGFDQIEKDKNEDQNENENGSEIRAESKNESSHPEQPQQDGHHIEKPSSVSEDSQPRAILAYENRAAVELEGTEVRGAGLITHIPLAHTRS